MRKIEKTKFNVDKGADKRTYDGIVFDSVLEMKYYRDVLCPMVERGEVVKYELQKPYELQPKFERNGKTVRAIVYVADFYIEYSNGAIQVVDVKGCPDTTAVLKRKLFWYRFPDIDYKWVSYTKKYGGWGDYDEYKKRRSNDRREAAIINNGGSVNG